MIRFWSNESFPVVFVRFVSGRRSLGQVAVCCGSLKSDVTIPDGALDSKRSNLPLIRCARALQDLSPRQQALCLHRHRTLCHLQYPMLATRWINRHHLLSSPSVPDAPTISITRLQNVSDCRALNLCSTSPSPSRPSTYPSSSSRLGLPGSCLPVTRRGARRLGLGEVVGLARWLSARNRI